jgi:hypothetical protein
MMRGQGPKEKNERRTEKDLGFRPRCLKKTRKKKICEEKNLEKNFLRFFFQKNFSEKIF